jgi:PIN domain nuclease of toxin-antitoxin system
MRTIPAGECKARCHFPHTFPADPADRLIAATARAEGVALVSRDARIRASRIVETVW